ncbi:ABC transporter permease [Streptomyces sp. SBT349]|uniref:ABC transporter permease n=1 Tax=Streptomyces sp. SBT349 TaxID=1580539 RepID=UPI00066AF267|nr:ABC transporter permease subunit [Streptomyces sp. SBT349]
MSAIGTPEKVGDAATAAPRAPGRRRGPSAGRAGTPVRGLLPLIVALGLWQLLGDPDSPYYPPPGEWFTAIRPLMEDGTLLPALGWSALTFFLGLTIATLLGAGLGLLVGASRRTDRALGPSLEFLRVLPAASLVPVAALILGYTMEMKLVIVVLPATWPILLTCRSARRSMSSVLLDVPRTLGLSRRERLTKVVLPAMTRAVLLGVRVAAPLALIITLLVEIVTRINGLGALLGAAQANFMSAQVYGLLVIAGALGYAVNWLVTLLEDAVAARMGTPTG